MKPIILVTTNKEISGWERAHDALACRTAAEGIVLLKNEREILPLKPGPVAQYGAGVRRTLKGRRQRRGLRAEQRFDRAGA